MESDNKQFKSFDFGIENWKKGKGTKKKDKTNPLDDCWRF